MATTPDSAIAELEQKLSDSKEIRRTREPQWFLNLAMHDGKQWIAYDGNRLYEPQLEEWRARIVDNRIRPNVRTEIARMTKSHPTWTGVPKDASDREVQAARMREAVFEHYWKRLKMKRKLRAALTWSRVCGAGFLKAWWDPTVGDKMKVLVGPDGKAIKNPQTGAPVKPEEISALPPELRPEGIKEKTIAMGDACVELRSPFELFPDDLAGEEGLSSAGWIIEEAVHSPAYLSEQFDVELEPDASASIGAAEARFPGMYDLGSEGRKTGVKVREFWAEPSSEYPNGKWCVWAQEKLLLEQDNHYGELPYAMIAGSVAPGRFWPAAVTTDLVPLQTALNKRKSQIEENADRIGNPPLVRSSANDDDVEWHGLAGEVLVFQDTGTPGAIPQFMAVPELPVYVREDVDRSESAIREVSGHYEISSGGVPAGVTAAAAINLLLEQNDTVLGPDVEDMEDAITEIGQRVLRMLRNYADDERFIKIAGEDGAWDLPSFRGDALGDCDEDGIQVGSGVPQSKAAKQAAIQEVLNMLVQSGVQLNERDVRRVLQEYEVGGLEKFFATIGNDERQVARENLQLSSGVELLINSYDDDPLHIAGHQDFQKTSRYLELVADNQQVGRFFEEHVAEHVKRHSDAQQAEAQAQEDADIRRMQAEAAASASAQNGAGSSARPAAQR